MHAVLTLHAQQKSGNRKVTLDLSEGLELAEGNISHLTMTYDLLKGVLRAI
ncbi:MAG: hypothetical protein F6K16_27065 [Symploca sp. SIO2B6]|nr:hypothetical protein [Symploca sp. SIO2B6]